MTSFLVLPLLAAAACMDSTPATGASPHAVSCGAPAYYRIDRVDLPERAGEGAKYGLDLDGDGQYDNAIGNVLGAIVSANPDIAPLGAKVTARVTTDVTWLVVVTSCDDGQHVSLGESGGGDAVPVSILVDPLGDYAPVAWARADLVETRLAIADQTADGEVGFALPMPDAARAIAAPFARYLSKELAAGTSPIAASLDTNHDGVISLDELLASDLGQTLLRPDLDTGGASYLSAGVHVHATRVAI